MASLITTLPSVAFPHEVDALDISSTAATTVELRYADTVMFKSLLYPINGTIALREVSSLLDDYLGNEEHTFSVWLDGSKVGETTIIPCMLHLDCTAAEMNEGIFLTRTTCKYTHADASEVLHIISESRYITIRGFVKAKSGGSYFVQTFSWPVSGSETIMAVDVSPRSIFSLEAYDLEQYTVEVGKAKITYRMIPDGMADTLHEFGFINSFMQEEYITLTGEAERELKVERLHAYVGGQYRNFQVDAVPHWTIHSGVLLDGMQGLFDDFISSKKIWRKSDNVMMAVTSSDYKTKDSSTALNGGTVTLRETSRRYRHRPVRPVKTFDETFDDTFQ